ncbi:hypothetical protein HELRODRAFT_181665 [Helobdella robusta]|uniref:Endonuclease/exonuclease/phosphatase domain-containing protein n=1 Tax=Helobdella robusta TaxID=6412 RepID=T1FH78_HELRO|nr:hypothetical protein HELRODRAFT_181665 [Helobdella robusta]ESN92196.1 hypothetical protein HELRODRAFT_181665 [Helobdella robusta]
MAARPVVISEVLYFLVGNFDLFDNETFINNTAEFFSNEDFIDAQKILKLELENVKIEKFEKPTSRGNTRRDKLSNKKGGGVGIFLKLGLDYTLFDNALSTDDVADCLCIEIKFHKSNVIVFAIYRPPNSDPSNLIQKLDLALSSLKTNSKVYLVGDFNLDLSKACSDKLVASFSDLLASFNFVPLISQPTRVTHSSSSIIDNIFTSNLSHHISGILLHDFSDHFPIFALCPNHCFPIPTAPIKLRRNLCPDSLRKINLQLSVQDWSSVTTQDNINTCCSTFYAILFYILDSVSPLLPILTLFFEC